MMDERHERHERQTPDSAGTDAQPTAREDELTFEVTDLTTGASQAHPLAAPADARPTQPSQRTRLIEVAHAPTRVVLTLDARALRIGLAAVAVLLVAGIVLSNLPRLGHGWFAFAPRSTPTPHIVSQSNFSVGTITVGHPPTPVVPTATIPLQPLGSIPQNCSPGQTVPSLGAPGLGMAVGHNPVWVDAFDGPTATLSIPAHGGNQFTQYGWQVNIILVFTNGYGAPVTLIGNDLTTNFSLWFGAPNPPADPNGISQTPNTAFTVDAQQAETNGAGVGGGAVFYPISMYLPGADCYHLSASWPGGSWQIIFAAGV